MCDFSDTINSINDINISDTINSINDVTSSDILIVSMVLILLIVQCY